VYNGRYNINESEELQNASSAKITCMYCTPSQHLDEINQYHSGFTVVYLF